LRAAAAVCLVLIAIGLAAAIPVLSGRVAIEARDTSVELVVDYDEAATLAGASGLALDEVLRRLKAQGITGVGVAEDSLDRLLRTGRGEIVMSEGPTAEVGETAVVSIRVLDPERAARVARNLTAKWRIQGEGWTPEDPVLRAMGATDRLAQVGVGWEPARIEAVKRAGLEPVARPLDSPVISAEGIHHTFEELMSHGMTSVLFQGKFVLGNRDLIPQTAERIRAGHLKYYAVELDVQEGTDQLSGLLDGQVIRTHSIGEAELLRMSREAAVERFARGVRERSIRCCFVRLLLDRACADPMEHNAEYVGMIRAALAASRFVPGSAQTMPVHNEDHRLDPLIGLGIGGGVSLALLLVLGAGRAWMAVSLGCVAFGLAQKWVPGPSREALALLGALAFPMLGISAIRLDRPGGCPTVRPLAALLIAAAASTAGGVLVAGLMSDTMTMMRVEQFRGTKLALAGPVLAAALLYGFDLLDQSRPLRTRLAVAGPRLRQILATPMSLGLLLGILVAAGGAAYMLARSGNAAASTQTGAEKAMRELLEGLLVYRPRTKEFLIGHPTLVVAAFLAALGRPWGRTLLATVATLGLTSLLNTFCHFHTPLIATLLRSAYGLIIGGMLGMVACALLAAWWKVQPERRGHGAHKV
jgi:hypothetical protein